MQLPSVFHNVKRILVTGADGFIGSHLVEKLLSLGVPVRAMVYYNSFNYWGHLEEFYRSYPKGQLEIVTGDIRDAYFCRKAVEGVDVVFHLAALIPIPYSYIAPQSYIQTNVMGTLNMLLASRDVNVYRFIHTSTSEVYGTAQYVPIDEKHPLNPQSPYAATKLASDKLALSFYMSFDMPVVVARPFNTFGPRQSARAVIPTIISQALKSNQLKLGDITTERDFNFVSDTVDGLLSVAGSEELLGQEVNIGSGCAHKISDVIEIVSKILGKDLDVVLDPNRLRPDKSEVRLLLCDASKLRQYTGWSAKVSFEEGIRITVEWMKAHILDYKSDIYNV